MKLGGLLLVVSLALGAGAYVLSLSPQVKPLKTFNLVLFQDSTRIALEGTHITNNGFCSLVWKGDTLDTVVCTSHLITEVVPQEPAQAAPQPQVSSLR